MLAEFERGAKHLVRDVEHGGGQFRQLDRLAVLGAQARLRVERVHLAGAPVHVQENHALGLRWEMRRLDGQRTRVRESAARARSLAIIAARATPPKPLALLVSHSLRVTTRSS